MNGHGYVVSPTPLKPPSLGSTQEVGNRWPYQSVSEREVLQSGGGGMSGAHLLEKNYSTSPRAEQKYSAVRNPCDVRSRYDASALMHEEQQRLHALYMEQLYRNGGGGNDMRSSLQTGSDMRGFYDGRQSATVKKSVDDVSEMSKSSFIDVQHYPQDGKVSYTDAGGGRCFQSGNGYPAPPPGNMSSGGSGAGSKRYASDMSDGHVNGGKSEPPTLQPHDHISQQHQQQQQLQQQLQHQQLQQQQQQQNQQQQQQHQQQQQRTLESTIEHHSPPLFPDHLDHLPTIKEEEDRRTSTNKEHLEELLSVDISSVSDHKQPPTPSTEKENKADSDITNTEHNNNNGTLVMKTEKNESCSSPEKSTTPEKFSTTTTTTTTTEESTDNGLPSYTAMIAQAILKKSSKSTLSDIYEYMEKTFPSLEKRGTGWRNCVRHTLSLNDCFLKLHRPENGRSCNWTIHPSYYESFSRGDYRKKRALRKRARGLQWMDPINFNGYSLMREYEMHPDVQQQAHALFHHPPPPAGMWVPPPPGGHGGQNGGYNCSFVQTDHLHHLPSHPSPSHPSPNVHPSSPYATGHHLNHHGHYESANCNNADCYCQYNRTNNCRVYSM